MEDKTKLSTADLIAKLSSGEKLSQGELLALLDVLIARGLDRDPKK